MRQVGHFIGGKHVAGTSGRTADIYQPMDGSVIGKVALASPAEMRAAVENAAEAQPKWAAVNPQRRARVLMKFLDLIAQNNDELAELLAREHGKTIADAKGDIQRGVEVVEFSLGIPNLLKGEFTDGAGPGIDIYSMRQPLGVCAGITPFNFPAMIPLWKLGPAIACGNAFILKPSERDPGVPMRLAELFIEAGGPPGILNVVNGDKEAVDAILDDPDIKAVGFVGSTPIAEYIYARGCAAGKRVQCFGGAKNHMVIMPDADMDQAVDALIGAGYGSAGERCMAISVAVPGRQGHRRRAGEAADPARREPEDRPLDRLVAPITARSSPSRPRRRSAPISRSASRKARRSSSTAATSRCRATRTASMSAAACSTTSPRTCASTRRRSSDPCCRWCAPRPMTRR